MDELSFKNLNEKETKKSLEDNREIIDGVLVSELSHYEQQRIKNLFIATFTDDRNEYQRYITEKKNKPTIPSILEFTQ
jgi:hypothetical protein